MKRVGCGATPPGGWSAASATAPLVAVIGLTAATVVAWAAEPAPAARILRQQAAADVVVYASELPKRALSEFDVWNDPTSPGGKLVGTPNTGGDLDPPPEDDPHVTFKVNVQAGVAYRCWIRMKVGTPKGSSKANRLWVQIAGAVDASGKEILKPGTASYLTAQGPTQAGWAWVSCDPTTGGERLIRFRTGGEATVRVQAGMEGVGFDQFVLSPERFVDRAPSDAIVAKPN